MPLRRLHDRLYGSLGLRRVTPGRPPAYGRAMRRQLTLDLGIAAAFAGAMVAEMAYRTDNRTETDSARDRGRRGRGAADAHPAPAPGLVAGGLHGRCSTSCWRSSTCTTRHRSRACCAATAWRWSSTAAASSSQVSPWCLPWSGPSCCSATIPPCSTPRSPRTSRSWPCRCCSARRSATAGTTTRPWSTAPRPPSAPGTRRPGAGSARNGCGSPATCTTSWPTRWSRSTCRREWAPTCSTATRSRLAEPSRTSRRSAARR